MAFSRWSFLGAHLKDGSAVFVQSLPNNDEPLQAAAFTVVDRRWKFMTGDLTHQTQDAPRLRPDSGRGKRDSFVVRRAQLSVHVRQASAEL